MSKTHKHPPSTRSESTPQKAIDRLTMLEADNDIREALSRPQEAYRAISDCS